MRIAVVLLALWLPGCATADLQVEPRRAVRVCTSSPDVCWRADGKHGRLVIEVKLAW